jgi:hypothetical protein
MTAINENGNLVNDVLNTTAQNQLIFIHEQREFRFPLADFGLTTQSSEAEVIAAVAPAIRESAEIGIDVQGGRNRYSLIQTEENLFLMPKPDQG